MPNYSKAIPPLPKETVRAANAIFSRNNFYIRIGEHLEAILEDIQPPCSSGKGGSAKGEEIFWALITFFQCVEGLTDVQAVDAIRTRTDWKFALHLSLIPSLFHEDTLCKFRQRILLDPACQDEFQALIDRLLLFTPPLPNGFQHPKVMELVSLVCSLNRLDQAQQAMNRGLEVLAVRFPNWLRKIALPHWYGRYNHTTHRFDEAALPGEERFSMEEISADIHHLLEEIHQSGSPEISELYEVRALDRVWSQFQARDQAQNAGIQILNSKDCNACTHLGAGRRQPI